MTFPPYDPIDQHSPYSSDLTADAQDLDKIEKALKQTGEALNTAELRLLICDMILSKEKPTLEVIDKYLKRVEEFYADRISNK